MSKQLPPKPHLGVLRKQARQLLRGYQLGDPAAAESVKTALPDLPPSATTAFSIRHAHQVVGREYGFASWQALVAHVGQGGDDQSFAQLPSRHSYYEVLATNLAEAVLAGEEGRFGILGTRLQQEVSSETSREQAVDAARLVIAGESGCSSLQEFAAAATGAELVVTRSQLAVLEEFHANFATQLSVDVTAAGQVDVSIEPAFIDQTTFGEYLISIATGNAVFQMSADFLDGDFAVNVPVQVLYGIAPGGPVDRTASVEAWGPLLARTLEGLWSSLHQGTVSVRECYLEPYGPLRFAPMYEVSLLFAYQTTAGTDEAGLKGLVEVCYPGTSIAGALEQMAAG